MLSSFLRTVIALTFCACLGAQTLRELADKRGIRIGAAANPARFSEEAYATTLAREFNLIEPENTMKFGPIHPASDSYNFGPADAVAAFGREHKMAVRGHTLVWHNQNPAWLTSETHTPEKLAALLQDHIKAVMGHFAGQVYAWDVINEAFLDDGSLRSTIWCDKPGIGREGTGYIEQALRWARAADPKALLFYNDFSAETVNPKSDAIFKMAQDFKKRGVPLDGIGLQMHFTTNPPSIAGIEENIKRITGLGLQVHYTELDVRLPIDASGVAAPEMIAKQAQIYRDLTAICLKYPLCTAIQTWGFTDKYSWIPGRFAGTGAALPLDRNYEPKPAYQAMKEAFGF